VRVLPFRVSGRHQKEGTAGSGQGKEQTGRSETEGAPPAQST
jgi:hypothetical protein